MVATFLVRNCLKRSGFRGFEEIEIVRRDRAIAPIATRKPKEVMMIPKIGLNFLKSSSFFFGSLCMSKMILCVLG